MRNRRTWRWLWTCAAAPALMGAGIASAQVRPPSAEEILRISPSMQLAVEAMGDEQCSPSKPVPGETASLQVASIGVSGATALRPSEFQDITAPLSGRSVSPEALERAAQAVVCKYRREGYVFARADVARGAADAWRIEVDEGVLGRLEAAVDDPKVARALRRAFVGLRPGHPINANDVRRGLVTASAFGLPNVHPTVRRSRSAAHALDIVLVTTAPHPEAAFEIENFNAQAYGRWGAQGSIELSGLTPLYDHTSIGFFQSLERIGQSSVQASSHVPSPVLGAGIGADFAYSWAFPGGALQSLDISSRSWFFRLSLDRYLSVRRGLIVQGSAGVEAIDQSTDYLGGIPFIRDRLRVAFAKARGEALGFGGVFNGSVEVRKGLDAFGALDSTAPLLSVAGANPQAWVWRGSLSYSHQFGPIGMTVSGRGQYTQSTLASFEQITFGALNGGRGFDPAAIAGDRGVATSIELVGQPIKGPFATVIRPLVFSDAARIGTVQSGLNMGHWAVSAGGGVRIAAPNHLALDVSYAGPIVAGDAPPGSRSSRLLVALSAYTLDPFEEVADFIAKRRSKP